MSHISYVSGTVIPSTWLNDVDTVVYTYFGNGTGLNSPTKLTIGSIVTPNLNSGSDINLNLQINGVGKWIAFASAGSFMFGPSSDNLFDLGDSTHRIGKVVTPIIDSGTTGPLNFRTNNGTLQLSLSGTGATATATLGANAGNGGAFLNWQGWTSANRNWQLNVNGSSAGFKFIQSTAVGGTTFGGDVGFEILEKAGGTDRWIQIFGNAGANVSLRTGGAGGGIDMDANQMRFPNISTTASAANAFLDNANANNILRSTSSIRYKNLIGNLSLDEARNVVLNATPIVYTSKSDADDPTVTYVGLSAEQISSLDNRFVTFDNQKQPDWVQYPHLVAPLVKVVQDLETRIKVLENGKV